MSDPVESRHRNLEPNIGSCLVSGAHQYGEVGGPTFQHHVLGTFQLEHLGAALVFGGSLQDNRTPPPVQLRRTRTCPVHPDVFAYITLRRNSLLFSNMFCGTPTGLPWQTCCPLLYKAAFRLPHASITNSDAFLTVQSWKNSTSPALFALAALVSLFPPTASDRFRPGQLVSACDAPPRHLCTSTFFCFHNLKEDASPEFPSNVYAPN